jgi:hypothetical protein
MAVAGQNPPRVAAPVEEEEYMTGKILGKMSVIL